MIKRVNGIFFKGIENLDYRGAADSRYDPRLRTHDWGHRPCCCWTGLHVPFFKLSLLRRRYCSMGFLGCFIWHWLDHLSGLMAFCSTTQTDVVTSDKSKWFVNPLITHVLAPNSSGDNNARPMVWISLLNWFEIGRFWDNILPRNCRWIWKFINVWVKALIWFFADTKQAILLALVPSVDLTGNDS